MPVYLPGLNQQTAATLQIIRQGMGTSTTSRGSRSGKRRRKSRTKRATKRGKARKTRTSKPARLVKGSAAAKAYMKKIRRKRKK